MQRLLLLSHVFHLNSIIPLAGVRMLAYLFSDSHAPLPEPAGHSIPIQKNPGVRGVNQPVEMRRT